MNAVLEHATRYVAASLSVAPVRRDGSKAPAGEWRAYQSERAGMDVLDRWFSRGEYGVAIIAGGISGNLEVVDVDAPQLLEAFWRKLVEQAPKLKQAVRVRTPKGGGHVAYRCESKPPGNQKLAERLVADPSTKTGSRKQTLIETRGEGGYILAPGSPPDCHPSKKPYVVSAGTFEHLPVLTDAERETVYEVARSFDQLPKENGQSRQANSAPSGNGAGDRPGDEFAARTSWAEILEPHGWVLAYESRGVSHWRRPGKTDEGTSATTNYGGSDLFYVFSSNADPFDDGESYSKFAAFTWLEHDGDFVAAAKALANGGYGKARESRARPETSNGARGGHARDDGDVGAGGEPEHLTDLGNAERLVERHGENLRWCDPWRKFFTWDGRAWTEDTTREARRFTSETVRSIYGEASKATGDVQRAAIAKHAMRSESKPAQRAMLELVKSRPGIPMLPDALDRDPWLLNALNGTIDLRTGELHPHRREDLITKVAHVAYDPTAEAPTFHRFLHAITCGSEELVGFLQRAIGYSACGDTRERVLFICYGIGANGKTTLLEAVREVLGDYAMTTNPQTFMARRDSVPSDLAALKGSRFVSTMETGAGRTLDTALVKRVTGNDEVSVRHLYGEWFAYRPTYKLWLGTNFKPIINDQSEGCWDRIRLVPFTERFISREETNGSTPPERIKDPEMGAKLLAEGTGILAWIVRGCLAWQQHGLGIAEEVRAATGEYRADMDVLGDFIEERCLRGERLWATADELYKSYAAWSEDHGEKEKNVMAQQVFGRLLGERGFRKDRRAVDGGKRTLWLGITLVQSPREDPAEARLAL